MTANFCVLFKHVSVYVTTLSDHFYLASLEYHNRESFIWMDSSVQHRNLLPNERPHHLNGTIK